MNTRRRKRNLSQSVVIDSENEEEIEKEEPAVKRKFTKKTPWAIAKQVESGISTKNDKSNAKALDAVKKAEKKKEDTIRKLDAAN